MKGLRFPIVGAKTKGVTGKFDLSSPVGRRKYFSAKVGEEIAYIKTRLRKGNTFIGFFLGKKNSGKGTYSKLFIEIFGADTVVHISVGDMVRDYHARWNKFKKTEDYISLKNIYRGYISFEEAEKRLLGRSQSKLLPTEFILALLKEYIREHEGKAIFIDGLPRDLDQISYSLYFRDLINYRDDPDFFILIDIPEAVINERIKARVICPTCNTSRNTKLLVTSKVEYDSKAKMYYLVCDNAECKNPKRMVSKEGDSEGIKPIKKRLETDEKILRRAFELHGVPKILLRNHVPVREAKKYFDDYEITPEYYFTHDKKGKVKVHERPWSFKDDNGVKSYSLMPPPVVVSMVKQLAAKL